MSDLKMRQIDGFTEILNEKGEVVHRQKDRRQRNKKVQDHKSLTRKEPPEKPLHIAELPSGEKVLIPVGLNIDVLPQERWPFGEAWSEKICRGIGQGKSLTSLCKQEGWPSPDVVYRWIRKNPEFAAEYEQARRIQADWAYDKVLQIAEDPGDDVKRSRLQAEIFQWACEVNDRRTYQRTTRLEQEIPKVHITVVTGVPDPDPIEVPSWDPKDDPEWQKQAKESPLFCQATTVKED